jgi:hypothetical protein
MVQRLRSICVHFRLTTQTRDASASLFAELKLSAFPPTMKTSLGGPIVTTESLVAHYTRLTPNSDNSRPQGDVIMTWYCCCSTLL